MNRALLLLPLCCCHNKPELAAADGGSAPPVVSASVSASASAHARPRVTTLDVVQAWNTAHTKHDTKALELLYAPHVEFYGRTMTNAACVAAKKAAFAKSPDYAQSIRDVVVGNDGVVTFTKTSTSGGKSTDYAAVLIVKGDLVTAETDKVTEANLAAAKSEWCWAKGAVLFPPSDAVIAPFRISGAEACRRARLTKYFKAQEAARPGVFIDFGEIICPTKCDRPTFECGYDLKLENHSSEALDDPEPHSIMIDWVYVDAVDGTLWYSKGADGKWEKSEPLPP